MSLKIQPELEAENVMGPSLAGESRERGILAMDHYLTGTHGVTLPMQLEAGAFLVELDELEDLAHAIRDPGIVPVGVLDERQISPLYFVAKAIIRPRIGDGWNTTLRMAVSCSRKKARMASGEKTKVCATPLTSELTPITGRRLYSDGNRTRRWRR